jgi:hypothetical protein
MRQRAPMVLMSLVISMALWASPQQGERTERAGGGRSRDVETYLGNVLIRTDGVRVYVMVDTLDDKTDSTDGYVDQWFILETKEPLMTPISALVPDAQIIHSSGVLRVKSTQRRFELVLEENERSPQPPAGLATTRAAGIGLSHNSGVTNVRIPDRLERDGKLSTFCDECGVLNPDPGGGAGGGAACSSGGTGAVSCSVSNGPNSCSILCASGYYACCNAVPGAAYCRCVQM